MAVELLPDQVAALDHARTLLTAGVPLFLATPDPTVKTGFRPPRKWQDTAVDPSVLDRWRPELALCAVMGHGLDLLDIDPRHGGDLATLPEPRPHHYAMAYTPSGGQHLFIASIGTGSRDNILPGVDLKGGMAAGTGRGFAFIAPTIRTSVVDGTARPYTWAQPPVGEAFAALAAGALTDVSGHALAGHVRRLQSETTALTGHGGPSWWQAFMDQREPQSAGAADRAITEKLREVIEHDTLLGIGFRHTLLRAALTLGGYVGGGYLDEDVARTQLEQAVSECWQAPPNEDDQLWIQQGLDDGALRPFHVYTREDEALFSEEAQARAQEGEFLDPVPPPLAGPPPPPPWTIWGAMGGDGPFDPAGDATDQGLAKAVAARMFPVLRYAEDSTQWIKREADVWITAPDASSWIIAALAELMPLGETPIPKEVSDRTEGHWQADRRKTFMSSAGAGRIRQKLTAIVAHDHPATLKIVDLDANPEILWAGGVPWNLRASGDMPVPAPIDPNTPHLRSAACAPDPTVPTPRWDAFLAAVLPDPEVRAYAMRVLSVGLTGYPDAATPMLYGRERSGKTSLIQLLLQVLGSYGHAADAKLLGDMRDHPAIIYDLLGRRLSFIDEGPKRGHDATERLKQLTGGGSMTARPMNGNPVTFTPTHTLVMTTNNEPSLTDPALRSRIRIVPCDAPEELVRPAREQLDRTAVATEAPGILAALMREAAGFLNDRRTVAQASAPISIRGLGEDIASSQDPVKEWVENCTVPAEPGTPARDLYRIFAEWHQTNPIYRRLTPTAETGFGRRLTELGYPRSAARINDRWFRPLSVLNPHGMSYVPPRLHDLMPPAKPPSGPTSGSPDSGPNLTSPEIATAPTGTESIQFAPPKSETSGSRQVGRQVGDEPDASHKPRSTAGFAPSSSGTSGSSRGIEEEEHTPPQKNLGAPLGENPTDLTPTALERGVSAGQPGRQVGVPNLTSAPANPGPIQTELIPAAPSPRNVNASEVAARATETGLSKAEVRKQLAAEKRQAKIAAAIAAAGGEILALPVAVDREGHVVPVTPEQAAAVVRAGIARAGALTIDVETSGYPVGHARFELRTVQLGDEVAAVVLHPITHAALIRELLAEAPRLHAHSATADLIPAAHAGLLDLESGWDRMFDTALPAKLADPTALGTGEAGLKQIAPAVLGPASTVAGADAARAALFKAAGWLKETKPTTPPEKNGWANVASGCATMLRYAASDVLDTAALAPRLPALPPHILARERLAQRMTARVTDVGVRLDAEHVHEMIRIHTDARTEAGSRARVFGVDNPGSDQQVAQLMDARNVPLPRTPGGKPSVAASALTPLRDADGDLGAFVSAILDYRHNDTVLGLFLEPYRQLCADGDGRARPTIYTLGTNTGRMSCVRPNLQQLSRLGGVRACITADPGYMIISADFSGVELRVAAALSGDPTLTQFLLDGRDLHWEVARQVYGAEATKEDRYKVKRGVFGKIYGGRAPTLAAQMGTNESIAQSMIDNMDEMLPQLKTWSEWVIRNLRAGHTQFPSYSGRVIHLPKSAPHAAPNYCIQGTARELLVDTLVRWRDTPWGTCPLIPVHDELLAFVPAEEAPAALAALAAAMTTELNGIPIVATIPEHGPTFAWQDAA